MGVMGAAVGTGVAMLVTACAMMYFLLVKSKMLSLVGRPGSFKPKEDTIRTAVKIGAPMGLQHLLMGGAYIVSTMIVAPLGTIAMAAHSLAITVESLCYMPGYGIAEAATTLVGQGIGAGQRLLTRSFARMSVALGIGVMTLMGVLMWIFAPELMALMSPVEEVIALGTQVLRIEAWAEPMFASGHYEPRLDVGRTSDIGCHPRPKVWAEGCLDGDGHRAALPWQHLPHPSVQRQLGRET